MTTNSELRDMAEHTLTVDIVPSYCAEMARHVLATVPADADEPVTADATQAEPQPVVVPQEVREWAERTTQRHCDGEALVSQNVLAIASWIKSLNRQTLNRQTLNRQSIPQPCSSDADIIANLRDDLDIARSELEIARIRVAELEANPQPVTVSPLALFMADKTMTLALECLRLSRPLKAEEMAELVRQTTVAAIEAAARIEGGCR